MHVDTNTNLSPLSSHSNEFTPINSPVRERMDASNGDIKEETMDEEYKTEQPLSVKREGTEEVSLPVTTSTQTQTQKRNKLIFMKRPLPPLERARARLRTPPMATATATAPKKHPRPANVPASPQAAQLQPQTKRPRARKMALPAPMTLKSRLRLKEPSLQTEQHQPLPPVQLCPRSQPRLPQLGQRTA